MKIFNKDLPIPFRLPNKKGQVSIGSWLTIPHPSIAEIMAKSGFDWLVVDMEHSPIGISEAEEMIRVIHLCGLPALVRVGEINSSLIKRVMDSGASGVIVPMVNTQEQARQAVEAVKYPPAGKRGVGLARAQGYGTSFEEYKQWVEKESTVIVQIEHIEAVENMDAILSVDGIDGFIVGPYDLSGSLGIPGDFEDERMLKALEKVKRVAAKTDILAGYHVVQPQPEQIQEKIKEGYTFIAYSVDFLLLGQNCRSGLMRIGRLQKG